MRYGNENQFDNILKVLHSRQNGCHLAEVTFKYSFFNEGIQVLIEIWNYFAMVWLTYSNNGLDNGLAMSRRQTIIRTNDDLSGYPWSQVWNRLSDLLSI